MNATGFQAICFTLMAAHATTNKDNFSTWENIVRAREPPRLGFWRNTENMTTCFLTMPNNSCQMIRSRLVSDLPLTVTLSPVECNRSKSQNPGLFGLRRHLYLSPNGSTSINQLSFSLRGSLLQRFRSSRWLFACWITGYHEVHICSADTHAHVHNGLQVVPAENRHHKNGYWMSNFCARSVLLWIGLFLVWPCRKFMLSHGFEIFLQKAKDKFCSVGQFVWFLTASHHPVRRLLQVGAVRRSARRLGVDGDT